MTSRLAVDNSRRSIHSTDGGGGGDEAEVFAQTPPAVAPNVMRGVSSRFGDYHGFFDTSMLADSEVRQESAAIADAQLHAVARAESPVSIAGSVSSRAASLRLPSTLSINGEDHSSLHGDERRRHYSDEFEEDDDPDVSDSESLLPTRSSRRSVRSAGPRRPSTMGRRHSVSSTGSSSRFFLRPLTPRMGLSSVSDDRPVDVPAPSTKKEDPNAAPPTLPVFLKQKAIEAVLSLPAVFLGLILNLLDGISYGLILFPTTLAGFPSDLGPDGLSIFFVSTIISQLVFAFYSQFRCANGSQMIEAIPFLYSMCAIIVEGSTEEQILPTTVFVYALSTVVTGLVFFALGFFRLGSLVQFFPRHILIGCIGGVGFFLIETGIEVCSRLEWHWTLQFFSDLFQPQALMLWGTAFGVAVLLQILHTRIHHPLFVPLFFLSVPLVFYIVVFAGKFAIEDLRTIGWIFEAPEETQFYYFYTYFDFQKINWNVVPNTIPSILFLTFFTLLHVPINVPSLAVTIGQEVEVNRELMAHGWSNLLAGAAGSIQNYLVYSNSVLYFRAGGNSRIAGVMLAMATAVVFFVGPTMVGYIPSPMVGALIFHLGIDLMKEAIWNTFRVVSLFEYLTILTIIGCMAGLGFIQGIAIGLLLACVFFVVNYSRRTVIRATYNGRTLQSPVRRLKKHQEFLDEVGDQIYVVELQGFLFFGTINQIIDKINTVLDSAWKDHEIQYLLLDFTLTLGVDYSAAEAFARVQRSIESRNVTLALTGLSDETREALSRSGIVLDDAAYKAAMRSGKPPAIRIFPTLNEALEWAENELLKVKAVQDGVYENLAESIGAPLPPAPNVMPLSGYSTPRRARVDRALGVVAQKNAELQAQGVQTAVMQAFMDVLPDDRDSCEQLSKEMELVQISKGQTLWTQGETADGIYVLEQGQLLVVVQMEELVEVIESVLPGSLLGEIGFFNDTRRSNTVVAAESSRLYCFTKAKWHLMRQARPHLALKLMQIAFAYTAVSFEKHRLTHMVRK